MFSRKNKKNIKAVPRLSRAMKYLFIHTLQTVLVCVCVCVWGGGGGGGVVLLLILLNNILGDQTLISNKQ